MPSILLSHAPLTVSSTVTTQREVTVAAEVQRQVSKLEADKENQNSSTMQLLLAQSLSMKSKQ